MKKLRDVLTDEQITTAALLDDKRNYYTRKYNGSIYSKDASVLSTLLDSMCVIAIKSCFMGKLILFKGRLITYAYLYIYKEASKWNHPLWKRLDMDEAINLFNKPFDKEKAIIYDNEAYDKMERANVLKTLKVGEQTNE